MSTFVQSTVFPANDNFLELLFAIDALKRASAESATCNYLSGKSLGHYAARN